MNRYSHIDVIEALKRVEPSETSTIAHSRLYPYSNKKPFLDIGIPNNARICAVLVLFYEKDKRLTFCLIRRSEYDGLHSGQMALPGGKFEDKDKDLSETALREAHEEIGTLPINTSILSHMARVYVQISNSVITPYIGFYNSPIIFVPNKKEVREIVEIDLEYFLRQDVKKVTIDTRRTEVPAFVLNGKKVWGATAMILSDLQLSLSQLLSTN